MLFFIFICSPQDARPCTPVAAALQVQESVFELMFHLDAAEDQLDFQTIYGSSKQGWMSGDWKKPATDISYLLDTLITEYVPPLLFFTWIFFYTLLLYIT